MAVSTLFQLLLDRIQELGIRFLPAIRPDLSYSTEEYDRLSAYILLVHAEIESFIEERVLAEVSERQRQWDATNTPSTVLMGLLAFHRGEWPNSIESAVEPAKANLKSPTWICRDLNSRLKQSQTQFNHAVRVDNHGLKAANVLSMVLPIGFRVDQIDTALLDLLEGFGTVRGGLAHSAARRVKQQPDPADIKKKVDAILKGLGMLDESIAALP